MSFRDKVTLDEVCSLIADCPHSTPVWTESGYLVIRNQNIKNGKLDLADRSYTDREHYLIRIRRAKPQFGDLILTREAPMGEVCMIPNGLECCVGQRQVLLRPNTEKVVPRFLLYAIQSPEVQHEISWNEGTGSTVSNIRIPVLKNLQVPLLPLKQQKEIATFLGALDDRIALLRETNATLEAIAQALFKSWFVDFDPVHAKARGEPPQGMDDATAALFPDSFEESELGMIPKGWRVESVYSIADFINGASYKAFEPNALRRGLPIIKIAELKAGVTAQTGFSDLEMPEKYRISSGEILFSWSGNPDTSIDTFVWSYDDAWLNQHIFKVVPAGSEERAFVLLALKYLKPVFTELARNKQTTGLGHVTVADLKRLQIVKPTPQILAAWNEVVAPVIDRAFTMIQQAQTLAQLRDTLLPKLISGQLRLPEAQVLLAEELP